MPLTESRNHSSSALGPRQQLAGSLIAIITTIILIAALFWTQKGPEAKLEALPPLTVVLFEVQRQDLSPKETLTGRLQPIRTAQLNFEVQGQITKRLVEPGTSVSEGESLLVLDDLDLKDKFTQAESQYQIEQAGIKRDQKMLNLAKKNLAIQHAEVKRYKKLQTDSLVSASQLDAARQQLITLDSQVSELEYAVNTAKARLSLKKSDRDVAKRNYERATLIAPFSGYINSVNVQVGDFVSATEIIATIVDTSYLDLKLDVRGEVAAALKLGQDVKVQVGTQLINGKLVALQPDPDQYTNTHALRIQLSGENIQSGMLASADLPLAKQNNVITIPVSSIETNAGENFVYVYEKGRIKRRQVIISQRVGSEYIISSGLKSEEKIVSRDVSGLKDGQQVAVDL